MLHVCSGHAPIFTREEVPSVLHACSSTKQHICFRLHAFQERVLRWIKPLTISFVADTHADLTRGKAELLAENALLRHQLLIQQRQVKRPVSRKRNQLLLVFLAQLKRAENCHGEQLAALFGSEEEGSSMHSTTYAPFASANPWKMDTLMDTEEWQDVSRWYPFSLRSLLPNGAWYEHARCKSRDSAYTLMKALATARAGDYLVIVQCTLIGKEGREKAVVFHGGNEQTIIQKRLARLRGERS